jgi:phenylalanine-4-hydroxylase
VGAGIAALGLSREAPPDFGRRRAAAARETSWSLLPEAAPLDCEDYFAALGARHLPVVTGLRAAVDFERTTPDLFADAFGAYPAARTGLRRLLAEMGQLLSQAAPAQRPALLRFYRTTADFGSMEGEDGTRQVFGARLLTSARHLHAALATPDPAFPLRGWAQLQEALASQRNALELPEAEAPLATWPLAA